MGTTRCRDVEGTHFDRGGEIIDDADKAGKGDVVEVVVVVWGEKRRLSTPSMFRKRSDGN